MKQNINKQIMKHSSFNIVNYFATTNYSLFKFFSFNREVDKKHVESLKESMSKRGFTSTVLVILTDIIDGVMSYYILDGQHRFTAASELGIEFDFKVVEVATELELAEFIADVNNSSKAWGTNQFLNVWSEMKLKEYIKLKEVHKETGVQITPLIIAYTGQQTMTEFRKGKLRFPNESFSDKIIDQLMDLKDYLPKKAFCRRAIIKFMSQVQYDHEILKPYIIRYAKTSIFSENEKELTKELTHLMKIGLKRR
jgi:hypothetical protein